MIFQKTKKLDQVPSQPKTLQRLPITEQKSKSLQWTIRPHVIGPPTAFYLLLFSGPSLCPSHAGLLSINQTHQAHSCLSTCCPLCLECFLPRLLHASLTSFRSLLQCHLFSDAFLDSSKYITHTHTHPNKPLPLLCLIFSYRIYHYLM